MSKTIALVDDDRNILTSISMALEREGFKVQTYIDGESALVGLSRICKMTTNLGKYVNIMIATFERSLHFTVVDRFVSGWYCPWLTDLSNSSTFP